MAEEWLTQLVRERRAFELRLPGTDTVRWAAAEDAARYRDAFGVALPLGLPRAFTEPVPQPLETLVARYARTHAPFTADEVARRFGAPVERIQGALAGLEAAERIVRGEFRPEGVAREWCDVDVLGQLRRRSLASLRREVEPVEQEALARFLPPGTASPRSARRHGPVGRDARRAPGRGARVVHVGDARAAATGEGLPADRPRRTVRSR